LGIKVVLANSNTTLDYNTLEGRALIGGLALAADIEWMLISERNKRGRDKIKRLGIKTGRKLKEEKGLSIEAVKALREKGLSMRLIGKELNSSPATIMRILHNLESEHKTNIQQSNQNTNESIVKTGSVS
jgi:DNA invertase Pin-like site-specific DNA recombinase